MKVFSLRLKSIIITAVVILAVVFGVLFMARSVNSAVSAEARLIPIYSVETPSKKVSVTFNCANGGDDIDRILSILEAYDVKATFFLLGAWAENHMSEVQKIYAAGHEIGNHSYSHNDLPSMSYEDILLDIQKCNETVRSITGEAPTLFRAPSGSYDNKTITAAEELGMTAIQWDVDTIDWKNIPADEIIKKVETKTSNGSVIQMHTGTEYTADALPEILDFLEDEGYACVPVGELIYKDNFHIDNNGRQIRESTSDSA